MFGLVCSGRPVAVAQQVGDLKFVFNVENGASISHVSLFILPETPFDPNYTALIYFQLPSSPVMADGSDNFKLLGKLSVEKPSAIFKIKNITSASYAASRVDANTGVGQIDDDIMVDDEAEASIASANPAGMASGPLVIGISVEPNIQAEQLLAQAKLEQQQQNSKVLTQTPASDSLTPTVSAGQIAARDPQGTVLLANKIVVNAYNYLSGFVDDDNKVSMKALDSWWTKFKAKLQNDPKFLDQ